VIETAPQRPAPGLERHVLRTRASDLAAADARLARRLPREALEAALEEVPDSFLLPLLAGEPAGEAERLRRRRAAYVAYLWKRLKPPRRFWEPP
jgi:hypothetical protein